MKIWDFATGQFTGIETEDFDWYRIEEEEE